MTVRVYTRQARAARLDGKPIACAATIRAEAAVKAGRLIWPFGITAAIVHPSSVGLPSGCFILAVFRVEHGRAPPPTFVLGS